MYGTFLERAGVDPGLAKFVTVLVLWRRMYGSAHAGMSGPVQYFRQYYSPSTL